MKVTENITKEFPNIRSDTRMCGDHGNLEVSMMAF